MKKLWEKVSRGFKNIKVSYKLFVTYIVAGLLPIMILFIFAFVQMQNILTEKETKNIQSYLYQATASADGQIRIFNNLSNYIVFNQTISQVVGYEYDSDYEMYENLVNILKPMLTSIKYFHEGVERLTIYFEGEIEYDTTLAPLKDMEDFPWVEEVLDDNDVHWFIDLKNRELSSARKMTMLERSNIKGLLYIKASYDGLFESFEQSEIENYGIYIVDNEGKVIYSDSDMEGQYGYTRLSYNKLEEELDKDDSKYTIISREFGSTGWTAYLYKHNSLIINSTEPMIILAVATLIVGLVTSIFAMSLMSKFITKRISALKYNMKEVEKGNLELIVKSKDKDEIGELIDGFGSMLDTINKLINEVYHGEIKQREYEMRALQAQINPHFLYNSLSLINWKAIESGRYDISEIVLALSTFYRTSLNKGSNILTIEDELRNMRSYVKIQLLMHDNDFELIEEIEEEILKYDTLNLVLQPIIENAIDHGIDLKEEGQGYIKVTGKKEGKYISISVEDNGAGMDNETIEKLLIKNSKGYGLRNVNERIKLYFGEEYHLIIKSKVGEGTKITIRIPAIMREDG